MNLSTLKVRFRCTTIRAPTASCGFSKEKLWRPGEDEKRQGCVRADHYDHVMLVIMTFLGGLILMVSFQERLILIVSFQERLILIMSFQVRLILIMTFQVRLAKRRCSTHREG